MILQDNIKEVLGRITHPGTGRDIVSAGIVDSIEVSGDGVDIFLAFPRGRDPFANSIKRQVAAAVKELYPASDGRINVEVRETPVKPKPAEQPSGTKDIGRIIAIASGKGGVGKSTVTANLAATLRDMGLKVGVLDADLYGPSQPKMFGVEGYEPRALVSGEEQYIIPADAGGIKISSIGFFIQPGDALVWRGPMAVSALKQLVHQTAWGELDYLLIDLPPGTGDVHLSIAAELKIDGAVIVSTPQQVALADVKRGIKMFRSQGIEIPVLGIIENMAWFTPAELPGNRYYIFGRGGARNLARTEGIGFLGEIPIVQSVMEGAEEGRPAVDNNPEVRKYYREIAENLLLA